MVAGEATDRVWRSKKGVFHVKQNDLFRQTVGPSGEQLKKEAFQKLDSKHGRWIHWAREQVYQLLVKRTADHEAFPLTAPLPTVTSDDIWDRWPPPADAHPSVMGPVFSDRRFLREGYQKSKRPSAHSRVISVYVLSERN